MGRVRPWSRGGAWSRLDNADAFHVPAEAARARRLRVYDCRHVHTPLLIMAGQHVKYIAAQQGHHSAAFTLDTGGHLMDWPPLHPVEWPREPTFPEELEAALELHVSTAPQAASGCVPVPAGREDAETQA
jgi:hypothetical protein